MCAVQRRIFSKINIKTFLYEPGTGAIVGVGQATVAMLGNGKGH